MAGRIVGRLLVGRSVFCSHNSRAVVFLKEIQPSTANNYLSRTGKQRISNEGSRSRAIGNYRRLGTEFVVAANFFWFSPLEIDDLQPSRFFVVLMTSLILQYIFVAIYSVCIFP